MKNNFGAHRLACAAFSAALLAGCAGEQQRPLYYWGDYQDQVYHYFKMPGDSPQAELGKLDEVQQAAASKNAALPPGFSAHLGLLYLKSGQGDKARSAFLTEEAQFPESKPYMDFLLKKKGAAIALPVPSAPKKASPEAPASTATPTTPAAAPAASTPVRPNKAGDAK